MKTFAWILIGLTLWVDLCLVVGVVFTGSHGNFKAAATIQLPGYAVDSSTPGGAAMIMFFVLWTGALAMVGAWALRRTCHGNLKINS